MAYLFLKQRQWNLLRLTWLGWNQIFTTHQRRQEEDWKVEERSWSNSKKVGLTLTGRRKGSDWSDIR